MRLQPPDQLSTVLIWTAALFLAIKEGVEQWPAAREAIPAMSAGWLNFVPLALLAVAAIITMTRTQAAVQELPLTKQGPEKQETKSGSPDNRQLLQVTHALQSAKDSARLTMGRATGPSRQRDAERLLPKMKAALLSANKFYGVPLPGDDGTAPVQLETSCRLIEQVLPYLYQGHFDEAVREGEAFLKRLKTGRA